MQTLTILIQTTTIEQLRVIRNVEEIELEVEVYTKEYNKEPIIKVITY